MKIYTKPYHACFMVVFFVIIHLNAQEIIRNGNFENGFDDWGTVELVFISQNPTYSGTASLGVSTSISDKAYVYQATLLNPLSFEAEFWIYPESGAYKSVFELVANWNSLTADYVARIIFEHDMITFTSLEDDSIITNVLIPNSWNKIEILADNTGKNKDFFINNAKVASLTSLTILPIEHIIVGDLSRNGGFGVLYYDAISVSVQTTFTNIGAQTGTNDPHDSYGVAWADYDSDGDLDLYVSTISYGHNRLYRNDGHEIFTEVAQLLGISAGSELTHSVSWVDFDNDNDLDLYVAQYGVPRLYRNDGGGFSEVGNISGFIHSFNGYSAIWADYDNDGDLDLFAANFNGPNYLYRNDHGFFTNVAPQVGIVESGITRAAAWGDYDNDGDLDLYACRGVSASNQPDLLYRNDGGIFVNVANSVGITAIDYSLGADWGDYDNDGDLDLHVCTAEGYPNRLYRNDGGIFTDVSEAAGVDNRDGPSYSQAWVDYDNDGDLDLLVTRGEGFINLLYENQNGTFSEIQTTTGIGEDIGRSIGLTCGDFNNDGFVDVYVPNRFGENALYRNNGNSNNWLVIKTRGTVSNKNGIGARLRLVSNGITQIREINGGSAHSSQNSMAAEFGLGNESTADSLIINWPSGVVQIITDIPANHILTITEGINPTHPIWLTVSSENAFPGDTVSLALFVEFPSDSNFYSMQLSLGGYFGGMEFLELVADSGLIGTAGWIYQANEINHTLKIWAAGSHPVFGEGTLLRLIFAVPDSAAGFIPVTVDSALFNTGNIPVITVSGGIHLYSEPEYGDVDLNSFIQAYDASLILQYLVGSINLNPQQLLNANVSLDSTVSALDASLILQFGVGIIDTLPYDSSSMGTLAASGEIFLEGQQIVPGETITIPIMLSNSSNILSFEGKITYNPQDVSFENINWGEMLNDFQIETSFENGEIYLAATAVTAISTTGLFTTLELTVSNNFSGNSTSISIQDWRWNEEPVLQNVGTVILTNLDGEGNLFTRFTLHQNYPNPFNPGTAILYVIPQRANVKLEIYNTLGQKVRNLISGVQEPGKHTAYWDGTNDSGNAVGSGIYYYTVTAGKHQDTRMMLLIR